MKRIVCAFALAIIPQLAVAQTSAMPPPPHEILIAPMPKGFKLGYRHRLNSGNTGVSIQEWVPENETVNNWTKLITAQAFEGRPDLTPAMMLEGMKNNYRQGCSKDINIGNFNSKSENGHQTARFSLVCDNNRVTGKPEVVYSKGISGDNNSYVINFSFNHIPTDDELEQSNKFFETVTICNPENPQMPCPSFRRPE